MKLIVLCIAVLAGASACSSASHQAAPTRPTNVTHPTSTVTTTITPPVTSRIDVPSHTMGTGGTLWVTVVIDNNTNAPLRLADHGCKPTFAIAIGNDQIPPDVAFAASCLSGHLVIPRGESKFRLIAHATYTHCSPHPGALPRCEGNRMPPLPPGDYRVVFVDNGTGLPVPKPASLRLIPTP